MRGCESRWQYREHRYDGDLTGGVLDEPAAKNDSFTNMPTLYSDMKEHTYKDKGEEQPQILSDRLFLWHLVFGDFMYTHVVF